MDFEREVEEGVDHGSEDGAAAGFVDAEDAFGAAGCWTGIRIGLGSGGWLGRCVGGVVRL